MKHCYLSVLCSFAITGTAIADCPSSLNAEKLIECITIEGAGENYQSWSKNFYGTETVVDSESVVSPVTGEDVRTIKPAAGTQ